MANPWDVRHNTSLILKGYLKREKEQYQKHPDKGMRNLTIDEVSFYLETKDLYKQMGIMITELIVARRLLDKHGDRTLRYISNNLYRIAASLSSQRKLLSAVQISYKSVAPRVEEMNAIRKTMTDIYTRLEYLNKTIVPENVMLTPIQEYLNIIGGTDAFRKELYDIFRSVKDLVDTQKNEPEEFAKYAEHIFKEVQKNGLEDEYRERLSEYVRIEDARRMKVEAEKLHEKTEREHNDAEQGLVIFEREFYKCLRELKSNDRIGISEKTIASIVQRKNGRAGHYILCCKIHPSTGLVFQYVSSSGYLTKSLGSATRYVDTEKMQTMLEKMREKYPNMAFDTVDLEDPYGNTSIIERVV